MISSVAFRAGGTAAGTFLTARGPVRTAAVMLMLAAAPALACGGLDARAAAKFSLYAAACAEAGAALATPAAASPAADDADGAAPLPGAVAIALPTSLPMPRPMSLPDRTAGGASSMLASVARSHRIDPVLLTAIVAQESAGRPGAVSGKGAVGLMQVMPGTARGLGIADPARLRDPVTNLRAGATYLKQLQAQFGNDLALTLAAYNAGPGAVRRHHGVPPYAETRSYVGRILARYRGGADVAAR